MASLGQHSSKKVFNALAQYSDFLTIARNGIVMISKHDKVIKPERQSRGVFSVKAGSSQIARPSDLMIRSAMSECVSVFQTFSV